MQVNSATAQAFDTIAQRAQDVQASFTPGAQPSFDDAFIPGATSRAVPDPLSAAAPPDAYFVCTDERGRTMYTRDGALQLRDGTITGADGRPVLGFSGAATALSELHVDAVDLALGRTRDLRIEADGSIMYDRSAMDPRSGAREVQSVIVGRVALARFPAATKLPVADQNHFLAPPGVVAHFGRPSDGSFDALAPMRREESRIDFERSLDRLHDAYVAFDALAAANKAKGSAGKTAMDLVK
jgi:flagellar basal body rod protein FlgG